MKTRTCLALSLALCLTVACAAKPTLLPAQTPVSSSTLPASATVSFSSQTSSPPSAATRLPSPLPPTVPAAPLGAAETLLPMPGGAMQERVPPPNVPACLGVKSLEQEIDFSWKEHDAADWKRVKTHGTRQQWTYFRCGQPVVAASAFYRQIMPSAPYNWYEDHVEEYSEGTLLVYNNSPEPTVPGFRWVYLWLFPVASDSQVSDLVAAWFDKPASC